MIIIIVIITIIIIIITCQPRSGSGYTGLARHPLIPRGMGYYYQ